MTDVAHEPGLDRDRLEELFRAPPAEFVARRDAWAKTLRDGGNREQAKAVKALRKPGLPAWSLNQLTNQERDSLDELLAVGDRLRTAQRRGDAEVLRQGGAERRSLVNALLSAAERILLEAGHSAAPATLARIRSSLEALALHGSGSKVSAQLGVLSDEIAAPSLESLLAEIEPPLQEDSQSGAEDAPRVLERAPASPPASRPPTQHSAPSEGPKQSAAERKAAERAARLERARESVAFAEHRAHDAHDSLEQAEQAESEAQEEVACLEQQLESARGTWRSAQDRMGAARRGARAAEVSLQRARAELERLSENDD